MYGTEKNSIAGGRSRGDPINSIYLMKPNHQQNVTQRNDKKCIFSERNCVKSHLAVLEA